MLICVIAYSYSKDAYEVESFELKCFRTMLGLLLLNYAALGVKDYSVIYLYDIIQFIMVTIITVMTASLYDILFGGHNRMW